MTLIVNTRAGRGEVGREMPELERRIRAGRLEYRILETAAPGDATRLARETLEEGDRYIVAVGGDGTINEVVNGMFQDDRPVREDQVLGVVAGGSGSDFVRTFGLPDRTTTAVRHLLADRFYPIDVGRITFREDGEERSRYFVNIAQVGFGGQVVKRAERLPRMLGRGRYFAGFWLSLAGYRPGDLRVKVGRRTFEGRANNVVIANCQFYGGGMRISPRSYPSDGKLDVQVSTGPKSQAFLILPKIYRGDHIPDPKITEMLGEEIEVEGDRPLPVEADGEVLGTSPVRVTVLQEALRLKI